MQINNTGLQYSAERTLVLTSDYSKTVSHAEPTALSGTPVYMKG
jgi:hypothetical protein